MTQEPLVIKTNIYKLVIIQNLHFNILEIIFLGLELSFQISNTLYCFKTNFRIKATFLQSFGRRQKILSVRFFSAYQWKNKSSVGTYAYTYLQNHNAEPAMPSFLENYNN